MEQKFLHLKLKQFDAEARTFRGYLSVFGNVDRDGDKILPGAFDKSLQETGGTIPLLWSHDVTQPIGKLEVVKDAKGLRAKGYLLEGIAKANEVYKLLQSKIVTGLSIGFKTIKSRMEGEVRQLLELRLFEGSLVLFPSNQAARVETVKQEGIEKELRQEIAAFIEACRSL